MINMTQFYNEELYRNAHLAAKEIKENPALLDEYIKGLEIIVEIAKTARKNGLLALEEFVVSGKIEPLRLSSDLEHLIFFIIDGTDPEKIKSMAKFKYYAAGYTGFDALLLLTYIEGTLLVQDGTYIGTFNNPGNGMARLTVIAPRAVKEYLAAIAEQSPITIPELPVKPPRTWEDIKEESKYGGGMPYDVLLPRFLNNAIPTISNDNITRINEGGYSYLNKSALFSILDAPALNKLYGVLPAEDAYVMYNAYRNTINRSYSYVEIMAEARGLFSRLKELSENGELKIDTALNALMAETPEE